MQYTQAFAHFGARLENHQSQTMAVAKDGSIVMSLWGQLFDVKNRTVTDRANTYKTHHWTAAMVAEAYHAKRPVRIVRPDYMGELPDDRALTGISKGFQPLDHLVGEITSWDPETTEFIITYRKA
jgi:hypothetical protein